MATIYRYTDPDDGVIKYVGIVWSSNRTLRQRVYHHTYNDDWNEGKDWIIEYFENDSFTRNDAEYYEAHLIHKYGTHRYYNIAKDDYGPGSWIPKEEPEWKLYQEEDFPAVILSEEDKARAERNRKVREKARKERSDALVPQFVNAIAQFISDDENTVRIYRGKSDEATIVSIAKSMNLLQAKTEYTFLKIKNVLERNGYSVQWGRERIWSSSGDVYKPYYVIKEE